MLQDHPSSETRKPLKRLVFQGLRACYGGLKIPWRVTAVRVRSPPPALVGPVRSVAGRTGIGVTRSGSPRTRAYSTRRSTTDGVRALAWRQEESVPPWTSASGPACWGYCLTVRRWFGWRPDGRRPLIEKFARPVDRLEPQSGDECGRFTEASRPRQPRDGHELVRRFNEQNNEEAGEHWTPRDAVKLMTRLVLLPIAAQIESGT
jgi:hypothetical protein